MQSGTIASKSVSSIRVAGPRMSALRVLMQMDEVLEGLGRKADRSGTSQARLTPAARLVGEGVSVLPT